MARGIILQRNTLKVLRAVAELEDVTANELLERIVRDSFDGKSTFSDAVLPAIQKFTTIYGLPPKGSDPKQTPK